MWGQTDGDLELSSCMTQASPPRAIQYTQRAVYVSCIVSLSSETSPRQRGLRWLLRLGGPERCRITARPLPPSEHGCTREPPKRGRFRLFKPLLVSYLIVGLTNQPFSITVNPAGSQGCQSLSQPSWGETEDIRTSHPLETGANKEKGWKSHQWQPNMRKRQEKFQLLVTF